MDFNFSYLASFIKSGEENDSRIPVTIIPNSPSKDRVNDIIVLKAFDEETINDFLHDGILDYDHLSLLGETPLIRAQAHIGDPEKLYVDKKRNLPICEGYLFKGNPYVDTSIYPALKSGSKRIAASVGGKVLQKSIEYDPFTKEKSNKISRVRIKHIAVTPLQRAVNQETLVMLRKNMDGEDEYFFNNFDDLIKSFDTVDILNKALEAGSQTDISKISGGQAVQKQNLEGSFDKRKIVMLMPRILESVVNGEISGGYKEHKKYLVAVGFTDKEAEEIIKLLALNSATIVRYAL